MHKNYSPILYLVFCIDTEGPLSEKIEATFERLTKEKGINLEPSQDILNKLQKMEVPLDGREQEIADYIHPKRLDYLENWDEVSKMLLKVTSKDFRFKYADKFNNPLTYSWFVIDIVGYKNNPRSKSIGFHSVFDNFNVSLPPTTDLAINHLCQVYNR